MQPWRKVSEETVYARFRRIVSRRFVLPSGEETEYEIKDDDDMVTILALTDAHEVVLVRQFRPGPEAIVLELPGGVVEPGVEPADAAAAELLEETGYAGRLEPAGTILDEVYSNRIKYVFVAHSCRKQRDLDERALTEPVVVTLVELRSYLRSGHMAGVDAGYFALDYLGWL